MMALTLDMLDVLGKVLPGSAPAATPDTPDFAQMMATAGQGVQMPKPVLTAHEPALQIDVAVPQPPILKDSPPLAQSPQANPSKTVATAVAPTLDANGSAISNPPAEPQPEPSKQGHALPTVEHPVTRHDATPLTPVPPTEPPVADADRDQPTTPTPVDQGPVQIVAQLPLPVAPIIQATSPVVEVEVALPIEAPNPVAPIRARAAKAAPSLDMEVPKADFKALPAIAALPEPLRDAPQQRLVQIDPIGTPPADNRTPAAAPQLLPERALPTLVERMVAFTPTVIDAARDLAQIGDARDMKFNVRPETLGPVAVSIERTEAGQNLRLGVETPAAVQAVRHAEPTLNDPRNGNPFVNVTVDLTASDQRGRTPRAAPGIRRGHDNIPHEQSTGPASTGRYA